MPIDVDPCRFFLSARDYRKEVAQYQDTVLRGVLPPMLHASANADGAVRSARGFRFPPYMVLDRVRSLAESFCWPETWPEVLDVLASFASRARPQ